MNRNYNDNIIRYPILNDLVNVLKLKGSSQNTITNYVSGVSKFLDFIEYEEDTTEITFKMFKDYIYYLNSTPLSKNSINAYNAHLRYFFTVVLDMTINLAQVPKFKYVNKSPRWLENHEIQSLISVSYVDSRDDCIFKLALCLGLRINEVCSLRVCDIHTRGDRKYIDIINSKGGKSRRVILDNTSYCAIQRYAKEFHITPGTDDYFFHFGDGAKPNNETLRRHFYDRLELAGIDHTDITFHSLRHTFAVNYLLSGGDVVVLSKLLGHSSLASTYVYVKAINYLNAALPVSYMDKLSGGR